MTTTNTLSGKGIWAWLQRTATERGDRTGSIIGPMTSVTVADLEAACGAGAFRRLVRWSERQDAFCVRAAARLSVRDARAHALRAGRMTAEQVEAAVRWSEDSFREATSGITGIVLRRDEATGQITELHVRWADEPIEPSDMVYVHYTQVG